MEQPKISGPIRFKDRLFSLPELELIREITRDFARLGLNEISQTICELLEWKRPNGRLKNHECRLLLRELREKGWVSLPALKAFGPRGSRKIRFTARGEPQEEITGSAGRFEPLVLERVPPGVEGASGLWAEYVARYHYSGYRVPVGANVRYLVRSGKRGEPVLACLQYSSPAWRLAARDGWIGWSDERRRRNLQYIVNHSRFLILPWVRVPGLAGKILSRAARRPPEDWEKEYGYRPPLLETLVDGRRFRGTCYRAANWIHLGPTAGRGRMDRDRRVEPEPKQVYVYPLVRRVQAVLCRTRPPRRPSREDDL